MATRPVLPAEIVDVRTVCRSFPSLPDHLIERPHILSELEDFFARGANLLTVEGEDGKGKTMLLAQFALRHPAHTVALFARPTSRHTYDPLYLLTDLCEQLHWLVYGEARAETAELPDDAEYQLLLTHLEGRGRKSGQFYYFIVDGLEEVPDEDTAVRGQLLDLIPFGRSQLRFLYGGYTGALGRLPERSRRALEAVAYQLTRFSFDEARRLLEDLAVGDGDALQLFELARGLPGHLAIVRRVLQGGLPIERLMAGLPEQLSSLFDFQWEAVERAAPENAELLRDLLAILAHDRGHHMLASLARLTDTSTVRVEDLLAPLGFLRIASPADGAVHSDVIDGDDEEGEGGREVAFIPEAFRNYAALQLASREQWVRERIVDDLAARPYSTGALARLPASLAALNRHDQLFRYLSTDYFVSLVGHQRPLGEGLAAASLGIAAAAATRRDVELEQLSLTRSLLLELGRSSARTEEVEARIALGDEEGALALALGAPLVEDRLQLLATVAKAQRIHGNRPSPEILGQLEQLAAQVDPDVLGARRRKLAITLLFSLPEVALRFLERADDPEAAMAVESEAARSKMESDPDLREWIDVAGEALGEDYAEAREAVTNLLASLVDPPAKQLAGVLNVVYGTRSADEALGAVAALPRPRDQVFVLREWLWRNATRADAARVVDESLDRILLHSDEEIADAAAFCDIAAPLPTLVDLREAERLVGRFDTFADLIERRGPSRDYVRLQVRLARAECRYEADKAYTRLLALWYYADGRIDLVERAACVAHLVAALQPIEEAARAAGQRPPLSDADAAEMNATLDQRIDEILSTCADQYHATRGIIRALAPRQPERALLLASRLNRRRRRMLATVDAVRPAIATIRPETAARTAALLNAALTTLIGTVQGDVVLLWVADRATSLAGAVDSSHPDEDRTDDDTLSGIRTASTITTEAAMTIAHLVPVLERCHAMIGARRRARAFGRWEVALRLLARHFADLGASADGPSAPSADLSKYGSLTPASLATLQSKVATGLEAAWDALDPGWRKVTLGFELADLLAPEDEDRARMYLARATEARRDLRLSGAHTAAPYAACCSLAVRAYAALLPAQLATEGDLARLGQGIAVLPGLADRLVAWADTALRCYLHDQPGLGKRIVVDEIYPLLPLLSERDTVLQYSAIAACGPALYLAHQETALDWIRRVPQPDRSSIYAQIAQVLLIRVAPGDPYAPGMSASRPVARPEALDICRLVIDIEHDELLYSVVGQLADAVIASHRAGKLSKEYQRDIAERVRTVVEKQLPDPNNIVHEGYKLLALAQVARMDPAQRVQPAVWSALATRARSIPNASDRALVLAGLAATTPSLDDRRAWLLDAETAISSLPVRLNRIQRYIGLSTLLLRADTSETTAGHVRRWLRKAMEVAAEDPRDASTYTAQRRLIDLAYQVDEGLARELAHRLDDDPARLAHQLRVLDEKKCLADGKNPPPDDASKGGNEDERLRALVEACWLDLGALHAGRVPAMPVDRLRGPLAATAQLPLSRAFPVYAWAIEHAARRLGGAPIQARAILRPLFEAISQVSELAPRLVEDVAERAERAVRAAPRPPNGIESVSGMEWKPAYVRAGDRAVAEQALKAWCAVHPSQSLILCDRFFGPEELHWVRLLAEAMPAGCRITVLTSRKHQFQTRLGQPWEWARAYQLHWRLKVSDQAPPPVEIVVVGTAKEGTAPFHDRRIVVQGAGVQVGTSLNALGGPSDTTMVELTPAQVNETESDLEEWARGGAWVYKEERLLRTVFRLDDPDS